MGETARWYIAFDGSRRSMAFNRLYAIAYITPLKRAPIIDNPNG